MLSIFFRTYAFWALFSLLNFSLLFWLAIPITLPLFGPLLIILYLPFLWQPLTIALIATGVIVVGLRLSSPCLSRRINTWSVNLLFLLLFLAFGDIYKDILIEGEIMRLQPDCVGAQRLSFFASVRQGGNRYQPGEHATFVKNGHQWHWSYVARTFVEDRYATSRCRAGKPAARTEPGASGTVLCGVNQC